MITEENINQAESEIEALNMLSKACYYYQYTVSDNFSMDSEIDFLSENKSNNVENDILLNLFLKTREKIDKLKRKKVNSD